MNFTEKLSSATRKNKSLLCVGLDPDPELMPDKVGVFEFNKAIIDATSDLVCAYKPNFAFYEALGNEGLDALKRTVEASRKHGKFVIFGAKYPWWDDVHKVKELGVQAIEIGHDVTILGTVWKKTVQSIRG